MVLAVWESKRMLWTLVFVAGVIAITNGWPSTATELRVLRIHRLSSTGDRYLLSVVSSRR